MGFRVDCSSDGKHDAMLVIFPYIYSYEINDVIRT